MMLSHSQIAHLELSPVILEVNMSKTDDQIKKALENIDEDRKVAKELLQDAIKYVAVDEARHRELGIVMAKYVETLQRSNEQLVKVNGLMTKKEANSGIGAIDKEQLFDLIAEETNGNSIQKNKG